MILATPSYFAFFLFSVATVKANQPAYHRQLQPGDEPEVTERLILQCKELVEFDECVSRLEKIRGFTSTIELVDNAFVLEAPIDEMDSIIQAIESNDIFDIFPEVIVDDDGVADMVQRQSFGQEEYYYDDAAKEEDDYYYDDAAKEEDDIDFFSNDYDVEDDVFDHDGDEDDYLHKSETIDSTMTRTRGDQTTEDKSRTIVTSGMSSLALWVFLAGLLLCLVGVTLCCIKRHHQGTSSAGNMRSVFAYLQSFDPEDINLRQSPLDGWHASYKNGLAFGIGGLEQGCDSPHYSISQSSIVASSLFMDAVPRPSMQSGEDILSDGQFPAQDGGRYCDDGISRIKYLL